MIPTRISVFHDLVELPDASPFAGFGDSDRHFARAAAAFCEREGIPYLDLAPAYRAAVDRGEDPFLRSDTHTSAIGHRIAAEELVSWLPARPGVSGSAGAPKALHEPPAAP
jgi:hypothetical protein